MEQAGPQQPPEEPADGPAAAAEVERLRAENEELRRHLEEADPEAARAVRRTGRWRTPLAVLLVALAVLLAPLSVASVWASRMVGSTGTYVDTVAPLAKDPAVQDAVARRITNEIFSRLDVAGLVDELAAGLQQRDVAPRAAAALTTLKGPIAQGVQGFVGDKVDGLVRSDVFATAWEQANRVAHQELVAALTGNQGGAVTVTDGAVSVRLATLINAVKASLVDNGLELASRIPTVDATFVIFQSADLGKAQTGFRLLEALGGWLPVLAVGLLVLGAYVARRPRRALVAGLLGVATSMLLLGVALTVGRTYYLHALPGSVDSAAAGAVFDALVRFLRVSLRTVLVLALVLAAAAVLTGESPSAVRTRAWLAGTLGSARTGAERHGWRTGPVGGWVWEHRRGLRIAAAALAALAYVFADRPTVGLVVGIAIVLLVVLAAIEFVATPPLAVEQREQVPAD